MIYENIERLCKEHGISTARLEKECGLGNATVRGWKRSSPTISKLQRVADYFGIPVTEILTEGRIEDATGKRRLSGLDCPAESNVPG